MKKVSGWTRKCCVVVNSVHQFCEFFLSSTKPKTCQRVLPALTLFRIAKLFPFELLILRLSSGCQLFYYKDNALPTVATRKIHLHNLLHLFTRKCKLCLYVFVDFLLSLPLFHTNIFLYAHFLIQLPIYFRLPFHTHLSRFCQTDCN